MSWWARLMMRLCGFKILPLTPGCLVVVTIRPGQLGGHAQNRLHELFRDMNARLLIVEDGTRIDTVLQPQETP